MASENASHAPGHEPEGDGIRQHQRMARGEGPMKGGDFGVGPLPGSGAISGDRAAMTKELSEKDRAVGDVIGGGRGRMGSQPHPDHGPHKHYGE